MGLEIAAIEGWLYTKLDTAVGEDLHVYNDIAPPDAPYPFITFAHLSGTDVFGVGPARYLTRADYVVRVTCRTESLADVFPLAVDVDDAIHGQSGVEQTTGLRVLSCVRTEPFRQREVADDVTYLSLGGVYRCQVEGGN